MTISSYGARGSVRILVSVLALAGALALLSAGPAGAATVVVPTTNFPSAVRVHQTFPATFTIKNQSTAPQSTQFPVLTLTHIDLIPACNVAGPACANGVEVGVFAVSPTAIGSGAASCTGTWSVIQSSPGVYRFIPPGGEGTALLATGESCVINYRVITLRMPTVDANPAVTGIQTNQFALTTVSATGLTPTRPATSDQTTVSANPTTVAVFRPSNAGWYFWHGPTVFWGGPGDIEVPADYSGDGFNDIAVFRPSTGVWSVLGGLTVAWGVPGDIPVPADYDGNGADDIAVFRPSTNTWLVPGAPNVEWGTAGDIPVPADYTGDGIDDIAVFRPSDGIWYVRNGPAVAWGTSGDIPVPADYNSDGTVDIAVFRPSTGTWFVKGGVTTVWGTAGDMPVPGDYFGGGTTNIAVFRPSTGTWFVQGLFSTTWGVPGDDPLPFPYAVRQAIFP